jgi:hypothetical protein
MRNAPDAIASIRLLATNEGGRRSPTPDDRLGCIMVIGGRNLDVRLDLSRTGSLKPGQSATVPMRFLDREFARCFVTLGATFKLRDGRIIGEGSIDDVFF